MRIFLLAICLFLVTASSLQGADEKAASPQDTTTLDTVLVTGEQPGPGLWKVSKGDHVLWILGAQYPLPKKMVWRGRDVEQTIMQSNIAIMRLSRN